MWRTLTQAAWASRATDHSLIYRVLQERLGITSVTACGQYNTVADCEFHDSQDAGFSGGDEARHGNALIGNWVHDMPRSPFAGTATTWSSMGTPWRTPHPIPMRRAPSAKRALPSRSSRKALRKWASR